MFKLMTNKTLNDILAGFQSTAEELQSLMDRNDEVIDSNEKQIATLAAENRALKAENDRAASVVEKISALIG